MTALLVIDFETVGLNPKTLTALEVAFTIADIDGTQRLPLRSRFCRFGGSQRAPGELIYPKSANSSGKYWSVDGGYDAVRVAKTMAEESGLFDAWLASPSMHRITSGEQLERLLLDDIAEVCKPDEYVHITGAGAARFDFSVLEQHCRAVLPNPGTKIPTHYRPLDTSIVQTSLLGSAHEYPLLGWGMDEYGEGIGNIWLDTFPRYTFESDAVMAWMIDQAGLHRAAPDVARSIVVQRIMWRYAEPLRKALGVGD